MDPDYLKIASKDWRWSRCIPAAPPQKNAEISTLQLRNLGLPPGIRRIPRKKCCLIFMFFGATFWWILSGWCKVGPRIQL